MRPRSVVSAALAVGLSFAGTTAVAAQDQPPRERKNSVYGELFGTSMIMSINYERMLTPRFNARLGWGFVVDDSHVHPELILMPSVVFGKPRHQFTAGIGTLALFDDSDCRSCTRGPDWTLLSEVGYRFNGRSGFLFKATLGLIAFPGETISDSWVLVLPGVSFGWSF